MILFVNLVLLAERHMTNRVVLLNELLYLCLQVVATFFSYSLQALNDIKLPLHVLTFFVALVGTLGIASLEELVTCSEELLPQLITQFLWNNTDGLPFFL